MTRIAEKIYEQALDLPIEDRLTLIDKLLHSTNLPTSAEIDQLWIREAKRRCREIDEGKSNLISGDDVFRKIEKKYSR
ncbi:MAG TPA: addiction module protein [Spirochaetota bacterium]|nr:addiction module protein [Spirochaetota bacterium]HPQ53183.1 addiction module protein [Spirochaetota bacterium]